MTYYQGNLYASTDSGLIAYNSKNGSQLWRYRRPSPTHFPRTNPVIANNKIFAGTEGSGPVIMGFNLVNGALLWERALNGQLSPTPVLTGNLIIFNAGSNTIALDQNTGSVVWQHNNIGSSTISPILSGNTVIVCDDAGNITVKYQHRGHHLVQVF
jgi:outer membrane protein assembly factor BamB